MLHGQMPYISWKAQISLGFQVVSLVVDSAHF